MLECKIPLYCRPHRFQTRLCSGRWQIQGRTCLRTNESFWDIGLRTQRACAHETYEDCPYYEQLQYGGDTQAQMLYTYAVSGRTCLPRQAIRFFHRSQLPEGLPQSRYPSRPTQVIPYWSLHYLFMLYDWYMYTGDVRGNGCA